MTPLPAALLVTAAIAAATTGCAVVTRTVEGAAAGVAAGGQVRDGALEFAVLGRTEARRVGDPAEPGLSIAAKGVFVVITVSVRNVGTAARTFVDSDQTLVDHLGRQFPVNRAANIYANPDVPSTRISPGDALMVDLVFDVPPGTVPHTLLLRQSASSPGVALPLA